MCFGGVAFKGGGEFESFQTYAKIVMFAKRAYPILLLFKTILTALLRCRPI